MLGVGGVILLCDKYLPLPPIHLSNYFPRTSQVFDQYQRCTGLELEEAVRNRFHGDAQAALLGLGRDLFQMCAVGVSPGLGSCGPS